LAGIFKNLVSMSGQQHASPIQCLDTKCKVLKQRSHTEIARVLGRDDSGTVLGQSPWFSILANAGAAIFHPWFLGLGTRNLSGLVLSFGFHPWMPVEIKNDHFESKLMY